MALAAKARHLVRAVSRLMSASRTLGPGEGESGFAAIESSMVVCIIRTADLGKEHPPQENYNILVLLR